MFAVPRSGGRAGGRDESAAASEPVESEAAERLAEVLLGRSDTAWGIAARVADRPLIYAVDAAREVQLPMTLGRFDAELLVPEPSAKATDEVRAPAEIEPELEAGFAPEFEPELDPRVESAGDAVER